MKRSLKRQLVIGSAALAVVVFAGGAYAATQSSTPNTRQAFLNDVAKRLGVTPQQLTAALNGATADRLQAAVQAGRLTQAQADALAQRLKQNGNAPALPFGFGWGLGLGRHFARPGAPGYGAGGFGGRFIGPLGHAGDLDTAANYLGLTNPQLFQQLAGGKSLAQIATAQHKTVGGLEQAMTSAMKTRLDKLVAAKVISSAQETRILSRFSARLSEAVNRKGTPLESRGWRFRNGVPRTPGAPGKLPPMPTPPAYAPPPGVPAPTA